MNPVTPQTGDHRQTTGLEFQVSHDPHTRALRVHPRLVNVGRVPPGSVVGRVPPRGEVPPRGANRKPILVKRGSVTVKIYSQGKDGPYTIAWREHTGAARQRAVRANLAKAKSFAEEKATQLANGETWRTAMGANDYASYLRAREILAPWSDLSLELACSEIAQSRKQLATANLPAATISELTKFYIEHRPAGITPRNIPDLATDLLAARKKRGAHGRPISAPWERSLKQQLELFAQKFQGPLEAVTGSAIETWLDTLKVSARTRFNYRAAILQLARYAKFKRHIPKDWSEVDDLEAPDLPDAEVKILTPDQVTRLLSLAPANLIPFLVLTSFAGVRHEEIRGKGKPLLDWSAIDLEHGTLYIQKEIAKTGRDRSVSLSPQVIAWLRPHARRNGPVCSHKNTSNALWRAKHKAGIPTKKLETRNTLRKSYISYQIALGKPVAAVAEECGTSIAKIRTNYKRCRPAEDGKPSSLKPEAQRWFAILPTTAEILQLNFGL